MHFGRELQVQDETLQRVQSHKRYALFVRIAALGRGVHATTESWWPIWGQVVSLRSHQRSRWQARIARKNIWSANKHHRGYTASHFSVDRQTLIRVEEQKGDHGGRAMVSLMRVATCTSRGSRSNRIFYVTARRFGFARS